MKNRELAHEFFYAQQGATGSASNMFYNNDVIYSYGHHFPMCKKIRNKGGETIAYLFTSKGYSVSTSAHLSYTRQAIPSIVPCFEVPKVDISQAMKITRFNRESHQENLKYFLQLAENAFERSAKPRIRESTKLDCINSTNAALKRFKEYSQFFKIKLQLNKVQKALFNAAANPELLTDLQTAKSEQLKKEAAKLKRKQKQNHLDWLSGEKHSSPYRYDGFDHLRIVKTHFGENTPEYETSIETSQSVKIDCQEARKLFLAIRSGRLKEGMKVHYYTVDKITDKTIKIGCHLLLISECLEFGEQLKCIVIK